MPTKRILMILICVLLLSVFSVGVVTGINNVQLNSLNIKYIGYDQSYNSYRLHANLSLNMPGNVKYAEEYYTVDSNRNPKFVSSNSHYEGELNDNENGNYTASFYILRPASHYTLVKSIILHNNQRIFETWLTKNVDFVDNTEPYSPNPALTESENIEKYEVRESRIFNDKETIFQYSTIDILSKLNVVGTTNRDDIQLRVNVFKSVPSSVYAPDTFVYKYFQVISDANIIKEISSQFKTDNAWIKNNNIEKIGMLIWNNDNKQWELLPTTYISTDTDYTYFGFNSTKLSVFAIAGFSPTPTLTPTPPITSNTNQKINSNNSLSNEINNSPAIKNDFLAQLKKLKSLMTKNTLIVGIVILFINLIVLNLYAYKIYRKNRSDVK